MQMESSYNHSLEQNHIYGKIKQTEKKQAKKNDSPPTKIRKTYAMKLIATSAFLSKSAIITCITANGKFL